MKTIRSAGIVIKDGEILLMHRIKHVKEYYVFPGGGVEPGETTEQAALREVFEETTVRVTIDKLLYRQIYDDDSEQFFYLCSYVSGTAKRGDGPEIRKSLTDSENFYDPNWYPIEVLSKLLLYPLEIRDWLIEDLQTNFRETTRIARIKVSEIRHTL